MFLHRPAVVFKPQFVFYEGMDGAEARRPLGSTSRDWRVLWIAYCISTAVVILSVYLCLAATTPARVYADWNGTSISRPAHPRLSVGAGAAAVAAVGRSSTSR